MTELTYEKKQIPTYINLTGLTTAIIGLVILTFSFFNDENSALINLLISFIFISSIGVGSLFWVALDYITGAVWSTPFRRVSEILSSLILALPLFSLPFFFKIKETFYWANPNSENFKHTGNHDYLNTNFFTIRTIIIFSIWIVFYFLITNNSQKQDRTNDTVLTEKNIKLSAVFMVLFGFSITIFSFDWIMSLQVGWYSSIFGVYFFSGTILAALAAATITSILLDKKSYLITNLVKDHYYSFGALLFGFNIFWAYIAFSQFLLMWYANLPEETGFYLLRWENNWKYVSIGLIISHFALPFLILIMRKAKVNLKLLFFISIWVLFTHIYDIYWLVTPAMNNKSQAVFNTSDLGFILFVFGFVIAWFGFISKNKNFVAINDPKLERGINFRL